MTFEENFGKLRSLLEENSGIIHKARPFWEILKSFFQDPARYKDQVYPYLLQKVDMDKSDPLRYPNTYNVNVFLPEYPQYGYVKATELCSTSAFTEDIMPFLQHLKIEYDREEPIVYWLDEVPSYLSTVKDLRIEVTKEIEGGEPWSGMALSAFPCK